jgi:type IX secretion system PorP/SprF family membrane protein
MKNFNVKSALLSVAVCTLISAASAQELQLNTTYGQAAINNPALLCADGNNKITMGYHTYYGNLTSPWREYSGVAEFGSKTGKSALGIGFLRSEANNKMMSLNGLNLMYGLNLRLNKASNLRVGFQGGLRSKQYNASGAVFEDMIDPYNGVKYATQEQLDATQRNYFNIGAGLAFNTKDFYLALGFQNANSPNTAFVNSGGITNKEPMRIRLLTGYRLVLGGDPNRGLSDLIPNISYVKAGNLSEMGGGLTAQNNSFSLGLGYYTYSYKASAVHATMGFATNNLKLGYVAGINMGSWAKVGGMSHELCISMLIGKPGKPDVPANVVPTPMF